MDFNQLDKKTFLQFFCKFFVRYKNPEKNDSLHWRKKVSFCRSELFWKWLEQKFWLAHLFNTCVTLFFADDVTLLKYTWDFKANKKVKVRLNPKKCYILIQYSNDLKVEKSRSLLMRIVEIPKSMSGTNLIKLFWRRFYSSPEFRQ